MTQKDQSYFDRHNEPIGERIAFGLERLATALRQQAWRQGAPRGLTPTQGRILTALASRPGATLGQVSEALAVRPATASEAVKALEKKGWVDKVRQPDDARVLSLQLTSEGQKVAGQARQWPGFLAEAVAELGDDERQVLLKALLGIIRSLQRRGEIPVCRMCITCRYFQPDVHRDPRHPHHCDFVGTAFGDADLRIDCPDHTVAA